MAGLVFAQVTVQFGVLPLLLPLISGFALIGPLAAAHGRFE
jgi:uncharacterized membrane protein